MEIRIGVDGESPDAHMVLSTEELNNLNYVEVMIEDGDKLHELPLIPIIELYSAAKAFIEARRLYE